MLVWIYALCQCAHSIFTFEHQPFCIIPVNYLYIINCIGRPVLVIINVSYIPSKHFLKTCKQMFDKMSSVSSKNVKTNL